MAMSNQPPYAELHCLSNFTFLRGASHPEELVERAAQLGYGALALTDECSLAGIVRAHGAAKALGIKLIVGSEFRLGELRIVLLATNLSGYGNLCELITRARRRADKGRYEITADDFADIDDCLALFVADDDSVDEAMLASLAARFPGRAWLAVELLKGPDDAAKLARLTALAQALGLALVASGDVHMHVRARRALQDTVTAIRLGTSVQAAGLALYPNGERHLRSRARLARLYPPELLAETLKIAERCRFSLDELRYEYPREWLPQDATPAAYLRALTEEGMRRRWPAGAPQKVRELVEHELALITELNYEAYFLTVHDVVRFAREQGILCQGRGSAANSAVCYCLGITEVDPARMEMLFERFVSKERNEPPDIDVDFEHERREEVIQYLYNKYGRERAALAATVISYRTRSALRDVGKALGLDVGQVDRLSKALAWWEGLDSVPARLQEAGFEIANPIIRKILLLVSELVGFPRHLSQHVGGMVMSHTRLSRMVPIENAAMPERTVIQWDKDDLDAAGLMKVDCLALGMLTAVRKMLDLIRQHEGRAMAVADIPPEDSRVYDMVSHADTVGVFQIESRAQMSMLPRLRPRTFYDLVIQIAIVRPGPIQGGMVHPYLRRRQGLEPVSYPHPDVQQVLARTLGVPIFQEQVIKLAMVAAGFSPGEADQLRRSMAAWHRKGVMDAFGEKLINGMLARGYSRQYAQQIFDQIKGFGEYGFPESHSASFALIAYVSAWLKYHKPAAFTCALLNSQPMGFYAPAQLVYDARRQGVEVRPVDVRHSDWDCTLEKCQDGTFALRLGLCLVKGLSRAGADRLVGARGTGSFTSAEDIAHCAQLAQRDLRCLADADSLVALAGHRRLAHWQVQGVEAARPLLPEARGEGTPLLPRPALSEDVIADYDSFGLSLRAHPLALVRSRLDASGVVSARDLRGCANGDTVTTAGLVTCRQRPGSASGVVFLTLEDETGVINVIVWPDTVAQYRRPLVQASILKVQGRVQREGEVLHVIAQRLGGVRIARLPRGRNG